MYLRPMGGKVPSIYGESYDTTQARLAKEEPASPSRPARSPKRWCRDPASTGKRGRRCGECLACLGVSGGRWNCLTDGAASPISSARLFTPTPRLVHFKLARLGEDTAPVTGEDLKGFSKERLASGVEIGSTTGRFPAFQPSILMGKIRPEWWLMADHLMVYATYNVVQGARRSGERQD